MSSFPEFDEHVTRMDRKYGHLFKDFEQLRYFAMLPISTRTRTHLLDRMITEHKREDDKYPDTHSAGPIITK